MYMGCHPTLDRGFVRKATPSTNTPKLLHWGMGMIWRHTPASPRTALLAHGLNLRRVEAKEGTLVPHRLHAVKELHCEACAEQNRQRAHVTVLGAWNILARVQSKKT